MNEWVLILVIITRYQLLLITFSFCFEALDNCVYVNCVSPVQSLCHTFNDQIQRSIESRRKVMVCRPMVWLDLDEDLTHIHIDSILILMVPIQILFFTLLLLTC